MSDLPSPAERKAERIAAQIAAENVLITQRMGWNLTLQGFLLAALGLSMKDGEVSVTLDVDAIAVLGCTISGLVALSISAAYLQKSELMDQWKTIASQEIFHPQPFGSGLAHYMGLLAAIAIPLSIVGFWLWVLNR